MATKDKKKGSSKKVWWIVGGVAGFLILLFIIAAIFGSPKADTVFKDMSEAMLKTKSVTVSQQYTGSGVAGESIDLKSKAFLDMNSSTVLKSKGQFTLNLTSSGTPMSVEADYITTDNKSYIRFNKLSSASPELSASFAQIESKLKNNWVISRDNDNFSTFAKIPVDSLMSVLPTPFANLSESQQKSVLAILQDKSTYTIEESSKVDINGVSAYKYSINYNKDQYNKVAKAISSYVKYFKSGGDDDSEIKSLTVWVNIKTSQIIKIEFTGTSKQGNVEGTIIFSGYNEPLTISKPEVYSIESELVD
jgi:hypothetical protein